MPVETRNTRSRDNSDQDGSRLRSSRRRIDIDNTIEQNLATNGAESTNEEGFASRRRRNRSQPRESGYQARGYRTRHLTAGDSNQMYLQEGVPEVARE